MYDIYKSLKFNTGYISINWDATYFSLNVMYQLDK
jgi:hypothetical protein